MSTPNVRKYILIPEYRPLYAMRKCFGPLHGPLKEPCPTSLDIIGELLEQSGNEKLTIMEVVPTKTGFSKPVELTPANYRLSYEEILAAQENKKPVIRHQAPITAAVPPTIIPPPVKEDIPQVPPPKPEVTPPVKTAYIAEEPLQPGEITTTDLGATPPSPEVEVRDLGDSATPNKDEPYPGYAVCGMSKKEWKAAKKSAEVTAAAPATLDTPAE